MGIDKTYLDALKFDIENVEQRQTLVDGFYQIHKGDLLKMIAQLIANHAPTPAPTEVIEKYARSITVNSPDIGKEFDAGVGVSEVATGILTRFASEIGAIYNAYPLCKIEDGKITEIGTVDAEKVDANRLWVLLKKEVHALPHRSIIEITKNDLAAAIKSAGGGKNE